MIDKSTASIPLAVFFRLSPFASQTRNSGLQPLEVG
nr:MAG TPA: hypothetical protein [Caudoviricetes sp.]